MANDPYGNLHGADIWRERAGINDLRVGCIKSGAGAYLAGPPNAGSVHLEDFFVDPVTDLGWTTQIDTGTIAPADGRAGILRFTTTAVDNDEAYIASPNKAYGPIVGKGLFFEATVNLSEPTATEANIVVGIRTALAPDILQDDGAGPQAGVDQILIYKVDGGSVWQLRAGNGAVQNNNSNIGAFKDGVVQRLGFLVEPGNADNTESIVRPFVDGVPSTGVTLTLTGFDPSLIVAGVKNGGAEIQTLDVDYVIASVQR